MNKDRRLKGNSQFREKGLDSRPQPHTENAFDPFCPKVASVGFKDSDLGLIPMIVGFFLI